MKPFIPSLALAALLGIGSIAHAQLVAPPNALNFQGRLATPSGNPVPDGTYSIRFRSYDAATAGNVLYEQTLATVAVKNGTFAVKIDGFTADKFNGNAWLGITLGNDAELSPRTPIVSVPYALKSTLALTVPDASITNSKIAPGTLTADRFASGVFNGTAWLLGGNSGVTVGFLGTTDNQPLVFRTNNAERMRIVSGGSVGIGTSVPDAPLQIVAPGLLALHLSSADAAGTWLRLENTLASGHSWNLISSGSGNAEGAGNLLFFDQTANAVHMSIASGGNVGIGTTTPASKLDVAGTTRMIGFSLPTGAAVGKVLTSDADGSGTWQAVASLLSDNSIASSQIQSMDWSKLTNIPANVGIGWTVTGNPGTNPSTNFLGTSDNQPLVLKVNGRQAMRYSYAETLAYRSINVLGGSDLNSISAGVLGATITGGGQDNFTGTDYPNSVTANFGTVGGGLGNTSGGLYATVAGGYGNTAGGAEAAVLGGYGNTASGLYASVAGGSNNIASGSYANVAGGYGNTVSREFANVAGGYGNSASREFANVTGGSNNTAGGSLATVAGGIENAALGNYSFAAGGHAKANHSGTFVWKSFDGNDFASTAANQFLISAPGGVGINKNNPSSALDINGAVYAAGESRFYNPALGNYSDPYNGTAFAMKVSGGIAADKIRSNDIAGISDARFKTNVQTLPNALDEVLTLRGVSFDWDRGKWPGRFFAEGDQIGFIAQEVEKVLPTLVRTDENGYKAVLYQNFAPVLVEAIKTQQAQIALLRKDNETKTKRLTDIEAQIAELTAALAQLKAQHK